jgi:hypothetical protein
MLPDFVWRFVPRYPLFRDTQFDRLGQCPGCGYRGRLNGHRHEIPKWLGRFSLYDGPSVLVCPNCEAVSQVASRGSRFLHGTLVLILALLGAGCLVIAANLVFDPPRPLMPESPDFATPIQAAGGVMALIGAVFFWLAYHVLNQVRRIDLVLMHRKLPPLD